MLIFPCKSPSRASNGCKKSTKSLVRSYTFLQLNLKSQRFLQSYIWNLRGRDLPLLHAARQGLQLLHALQDLVTQDPDDSTCRLLQVLVCFLQEHRQHRLRPPACPPAEPHILQCVHRFLPASASPSKEEAQASRSALHHLRILPADPAGSAPALQDGPELALQPECYLAAAPAQAHQEDAQVGWRLLCSEVWRRALREHLQ